MSGDAQEAVFTIGVPLGIYAFHRYSESSASLYVPLAYQFRQTFLSLAEDFH